MFVNIPCFLAPRFMTWCQAPSNCILTGRGIISLNFPCFLIPLSAHPCCKIHTKSTFPYTALKTPFCGISRMRGDRFTSMVTKTHQKCLAPTWHVPDPLSCFFFEDFSGDLEEFALHKGFVEEEIEATLFDEVAFATAEAIGASRY